MRRSATLAGLMFTAPWLIGASVFIFLPMVMSAWYSLTEYPMLRPPVYIGVENYRELLGDKRFWLVVSNTAIFAAISIPLSTVVALVLAALISTRGLRWAGFYKAAIFVPTLVPMMASAMVWLWLFNGKLGLINAALAVVGVAGPSWLEDAWYAIPAVALTSVWGVGQMVVVYSAAMQEVPRELYEAGNLDGMGPLRRFWHVTLPMISPVVLFNAVTLMIGTLQVFAIPYVLFRNERGQRDEGYYYAMMLYDNAFVQQRMGYASAMAWIQLLIILALTGAAFALSRRFVHYRAE
ncbi:MAG: carbohydrate ABC transporter permease [Phycisphaerales bacterium]